jgi:signal transduction histidine kinase
VLDIRTLYVAHFAVIITVGLVMLLSRRRQPETRSVGIWGGGAVCFGIGMVLSALRGIAPDWLSVLVSNALGALYPVMIWNGLRKFNGRATRWPASLVLVFGFVASLAYFLYVDENLSARIIIASLVLAAGATASAYELFRWTDPDLRRMSWTGGTALFLVAVIQLGRAYWTWSTTQPYNLFTPSASNQLGYLTGIILSALVIFSLAMMANLQLQQQLADRSVDLERIARDRDQARLRAEEANRAKSVFLTMMSHELRTPLNVILGFSELGPMVPAETALPARVKEYFGLINESGNHLLRVINDILDLSKVEAGKMELECTDLDVDYVINGTLRLIAQQASNRAQHLEVAIDAPPPLLFADERAVRQILFNLLSNAVRFTPDGGTIRVRAEAATDGGAEIIVSDTGVGIPKDQVARVTMPFEQIDNSYTRAHGGTGLGLPLVDGLVRLHGGSLTIDSEVGVGTRIAVRFPPQPKGRHSREAPSLSTAAAGGLGRH